MKLIGKKIVATLLGFSTIGAVAVVSFGLTNCGPEKPKNIENIITDRDIGGPYGGDIPSEGQIWTWLIAANPKITRVNLQFENIIIANIVENSCDIAANSNSGFVGIVHVTYNTTEPTWTYWANGSFHVPLTVNLTSRYVGEVTISAQTDDWFVHHYSFDFVLNDGTAISTPSLAGPDTGYHFDNLQTPQYQGTWGLDKGCIRYSNDGSLFGLNRIIFDICKDEDDSKVLTMELDLTYQ
ncbi:MAG: hypothetical protein LBV48_01525, partial [Mycoplasmataceae bacterium]|nr:hypothetical protein [Mycoplasmataceae bacterium]